MPVLPLLFLNENFPELYLGGLKKCNLYPRPADMGYKIRFHRKAAGQQPVDRRETAEITQNTIHLSDDDTVSSISNVLSELGATPFLLLNSMMMSAEGWLFISLLMVLALFFAARGWGWLDTRQGHKSRWSRIGSLLILLSVVGPPIAAAGMVRGLQEKIVDTVHSGHPHPGHSSPGLIFVCYKEVMQTPKTRH